MRLLRPRHADSRPRVPAGPSAGRRLWEDLRPLDLARATTAAVTTVDAWLDGSAQPATLASDRLAGLAEVLDRLEAAGMVEAEIRGEWLRAPNAAFEGRAPLDVVALGDADRVVSYVAVLS